MFTTLLQIFLPILVAYALSKTGYVRREHTPIIRNFVLRITIPCLIFMNMMRTDLATISQFLPMSLGFLIMTLLLYLSGMLLFAWVKDRRLRAVYVLTLCFGNYAYVGWAVLQESLGSAGLSRGIFFTTLYWPVLFLMGFVIAFTNGLMKEGNFSVRQYLPNILAPIVSLVLGIALNLAGVGLPDILVDFLDNFGAMSVPLILFTVGMSISLRKGARNILRILPVALARPLLGLATGFAAVFILGVTDPVTRKVLIIEGVMPTAVLVVLIGEMFDLDTELISAITVVSTIVALASLPLGLWIAGAV